MTDTRLAAITNPALKNAYFSNPSDSGAGLAYYVAQVWRSLVVVGALAFLIYFVWGSLDWLMSGGDKAKVEGAQKKITGALIGLTMLVISFAVVIFVEQVLGIEILNIDWSF
jgi:hypothetical protein